MAIAPPLTPTTREAGKDQIERNSILKEFGQRAVVLRTMLYQDRSLSEVEFFFMDNHFQLLEMAYLRWKRKHGNIGH